MQQCGLDFWQDDKLIKVALSAALKPTASRDLEPRSMLYLRRTFPPPPKKKVPDPLIKKITYLTFVFLKSVVGPVVFR